MGLAIDREKACLNILPVLNVEIVLHLGEIYRKTGRAYNGKLLIMN
jgi:hypothetical protein